MPFRQVAFRLGCYMPAGMHLTDCNRRAFMGVAAGIALAGVAICSSRGKAATFQIQRSPAEWRRRLGPDRYHILREAGTERPYSSPLLREKRKGIYACAGCGLP